MSTENNTQTLEPVVKLEIASVEIDVEYMNEMITAYKKNIQPVLTHLKKLHSPGSGDSINDATSAWVSFKDLQEFIDTNANDPVKADGVRIYYGIHTRTCIPENSAVDQKGFHNIILVPTKSSDPNDISYRTSLATVPIDNPQLEFGAGAFTLISGIGKATITESRSDDTAAAQSFSVQDSFPLCPPNCPGTK